MTGGVAGSTRVVVGLLRWINHCIGA